MVSSHRLTSGVSPSGNTHPIRPAGCSDGPCSSGPPRRCRTRQTDRRCSAGEAESWRSKTWGEKSRNRIRSLPGFFCPNKTRPSRIVEIRGGSATPPGPVAAQMDFFNRMSGPGGNPGVLFVVRTTHLRTICLNGFRVNAVYRNLLGGRPGEWTGCPLLPCVTFLYKGFKRDFQDICR